MQKHSLFRLYRRMLINRRGRKGNIVMFHAARCGSIVIGDLLNQHPDISWLKEIFNPKRKEYIKPDWKRDPVRKTVLWHLHRIRCSYAGFETTIMLGQQLDPGNINLSIEQYVRLLESAGITHYIILRRENQLRRFLSAQVARVKKMMHSRTTVNQPTLVKIDVNNAIIGNRKMPLLDMFHQIDERYDQLFSSLSDCNTLSLVYEKDIQNDPKVAYYKLCDFIGIEKLPVNLNYQRTNPFPLLQVIENYDEVAGKLKGTRYEWMLQD